MISCNLYYYRFRLQFTPPKVSFHCFESFLYVDKLMHFKLILLSTMKLGCCCLKNVSVCSGAGVGQVIDVKTLAALSPPASDSLEGLLDMFKFSL